MDVEKRSSKGGFLQLFDWNVKSRKKLFSNRAELPDGSHQGKANFDNSTASLVQQIKLHEKSSGPGFKGSSVYSSTPSVGHDDGLRTKAPGVVARLMGLDSLPTSSENSGPSFTKCPDSCSFRDTHLFWGHTGSLHEHHIIECVDVQNKLDEYSLNPVEIRLPKVQNRPIERFQTEILPPKSAKPIPVTHHKLLSPIKSPGFISTRNPAYVMEAAAKIIEQSPQSTAKMKLPSFASSSVPLKIRDLKEKMEATRRASKLPEASQRPKEPYSVKNMRGHPADRSRIASENTQLIRTPAVSKKISPENSKLKGKSVSLAVQAKVNVQRREGLASDGCRSSAIQKVNNEFGSGSFDKNQICAHKKTSRRASEVLRQNNQKQNCPTDKDLLNLKSSLSRKQDKTVQPMNVSNRSKTLNKGVLNSTVGARKVNLVAADTIKEPSSKSRKALGKKLNFIGDVQYEGGVVNKLPIYKNEQSVKCSVSIDGCTDWDAVDRKTGMDVVSFTFTSPIKKSVPELQSSDQDMERNSSSFVHCFNDEADSKHSTISSMGMNVVGTDALSVLLEKKLKELTCRVESSHCNVFEAGPASSSVSTLLDSAASLGEVIALPTEHIQRSQLGPSKDMPDSQYQVDCSSVERVLLKAKEKLQGVEEKKECSSSNNIKNGLELGRQPSPVSSLEPSFSDGSCNSLEEGITGFSSNSTEHFALADAREMVFSSSAPKHQPVESETELSDSASSTFVGSIDRKDIFDTERLPHWDLKYVGSIIGNMESMLKDGALCQHYKVIMPDLFDHLENQKSGFNSPVSGDGKLGRKLLFDCVSECMDSKFERLFGGGYKAWAKWTTHLRRKEWLVEELYREISGWTRMEELMADELVENDMTTNYGKWIDFGFEAFEEGIEIEKEILTSLVDELVADIFIF